MKISAAIITHQAGPQFERCLASLAFCDEILVVVQASDEETAAACVRHGARLEQTEWLGFGRTKQRAADLCRNRWILSIDSDEEVTPELRAAIGVLPDEPPAAAFAINRLSTFLGRRIRHCGWHPDWVVRLFDRQRAGFDTRAVHEAVHARGPVLRLQGLLAHEPYATMEQYIAKLDRYTTVAAAELAAQGRRSSPLGAILRAHAAFWRMWVLQKGFCDGWAGTVLCHCSAFYVLSKYLKLWRLGRP